MKSIRGLDVLVSGAASGIGRQVACDLARQGVASLRLLDVDQEGLASLAEELRDSSRSNTSAEARVATLTTHRIDISNVEDLGAFAANLGDAPLDVLVHCAGVLCVGSFEQLPMADVERIITINLLGTVRLTRALLPRLLRSERGCIVNVASIAGLVSAPALSAYAASKFGLVGFSQALETELRGRIDVCTVCPGLVRTNIVRHARFGSHAGLDQPDERNTIDAALERLGISAEQASRAIIRAIERRPGLVLVGPDAHLLYHAHRLFPRLFRLGLYAAHRWLLRRGVLSA